MVKKEIYNDAWFFYKKHINGDGSDKYWEEVISEAEEIIKKHNKDLFARELLNCIINELSRK